MESKLLLTIFAMLISYAQARSVHKRAAFYIANETACVVDNTVYYNGDPIPTDDPCESCKCRPPGFACVLKECEVKPGCRAVRRAGHCCPDYVCGCEHNGRTYRDGDEIRDSQNPCYTCHCQGVAIACAFVDCFFRVDCAPKYFAGECCPRYEHCTYTDSTRNASFTTVSTLVVSKIRTTSSITDGRKSSAYFYDKPLVTTLASDDGASTQTPAIEKEEISTSYFVHDPSTKVDLAIRDRGGATEERTEAPDTSTVEYKLDKYFDALGPDKIAQDSKLDEHVKTETKSEVIDEISTKPNEESNNTSVNVGNSAPEHEEGTNSDTKVSATVFEKATTVKSAILQSAELGSHPSSELDVGGGQTSTTESPVSTQVSPDKEINEIKEKYTDPKEESGSDANSQQDTEIGTDSSSSLQGVVETPEKEDNLQSPNEKPNEDAIIGSHDELKPHIYNTFQTETTIEDLRTTGITSVQVNADEDGKIVSEVLPEKSTDSNTKHKTDSLEGTAYSTSEDHASTLIISKKEEEQIVGSSLDEQELPHSSEVSEQAAEEQSSSTSLHTEVTTLKVPIPLVYLHYSSTDDSKKSQPDSENILNLGTNGEKVQPDIPDSASNDILLTTQSPEEKKLLTPIESSDSDKGRETTDREYVDHTPEESNYKDKNDVEKSESKQDRGLKTASKSANDTDQEIKQEDVRSSTLEAQQPYTIPPPLKTIPKGKVDGQELLKTEGADIEQDDSKQDRSVKTASKIQTGAKVQERDPHDDSRPIEKPLDQEQLSAPPSQSTKTLATVDEQLQESPSTDTKNEQDHPQQDHSVETAGKSPSQETKHQYDITLPSIDTALDEMQQTISDPKKAGSDQNVHEEHAFLSKKATGPKDSPQQNDPKQNPSIKTVRNAESDAGPQNEEEVINTESATTQVTSVENEPTTLVSQDTKSTYSVDEENRETTNKEEIIHKPEEYRNESYTGQEDSKQNRSVKTASQTPSNTDETQETVQHDDIRLTSEKSILDEQQLSIQETQNIKSDDNDNRKQEFPSWEEISHKSGGNGQAVDNSRQHRNVKTAGNGASDTKAQKADHHDDITSPSPEVTLDDNEQSTLSPQNIKSEDSLVQDEQEIKSIKGIIHKQEGYENKDIVGKEDSKQDRSVKTASKSPSKTEAQETVQHDEIRPSPTQIILDEERPSTLASIKTKSKDQSNEEQKFPSWEEISHKSEGNGQTGGLKHYDSRQYRSIKTASNSTGDTVEQKAEQHKDSTSPLPESTLGSSETFSTTSQTLKSKDAIDNGDAAQDDSKQGLNIKTADKVGSKAEAAEKQQHNSPMPFTTEIILDDEKLSTPSLQKTEAKESGSVGQDDIKQDRSVKTASSSPSKTETQETVKQDEIRPPLTEIVLDEELLTTPAYQKTKPKETENKEQRFPSWEEINYKSGGSGQTSGDSRQRRSVKTANNSVSDTKGQITQPQDDIIYPSLEVTLDDNEPLPPSPQNIKSKGSVDEHKQEITDIKGIIHKHEEYEDKDIVGQEDSKQDRSVKTASKSPSKTESQETVQHDKIRPSPTQIILDEEMPTTPTSIKTKSRDKNREEQKFPTWEEISYKSGGNGQAADDSRQHRNVKTATNNASDTEAQIAEHQDDITSPSPEITLDDDEQSTSSFQNVKSKGGVNEDKQGIKGGIKEISHKHEEYENEESVGQEDSKQDRSVKTASKSPSKTEAQETVQHDEIRPPPTQIILNEERLTTPFSQNIKSGEQSSGEQRFPSWEEIKHKSEGNDQKSGYSRQDRSVKTTNNTALGIQAQKAEQEYVITLPTPEVTLDDNEQSTLSPQNIKDSVVQDKQEIKGIKGTVHKREEYENKDIVGQEDSKQDRSVKTASKSPNKTETQETVQHDEIRPSPTQIILDEEWLTAPTSPKPKSKDQSSEEQRFPSWEEIKHKSEGNDQKSGYSRQDRSAKTTNNTALGIQAQKTEYQYVIIPPTPEVTLDDNERSTISPQNIKSKESLDDEKQEIKGIKGIIHKHEEYDKVDNVGQEDSKQDRSVKTASKTEAQEAVQQEEIKPSSTEVILDEELLSTPASIKTKSRDKNREEQRFPSWEEISHKSGENGQVADDSRQHRNVKTATNSASYTEAQIAEHHDDITSPSPEVTSDDNEQSTSSFQNIKSSGSGDVEQKETAGIKGIVHERENKEQVGQDDSKQDRSVKTASKSPSKTEAQETVQDEIRSSPTQVILDEEWPSTPSSIKTKSRDKNKEEQKFPTWEEIKHKSEGNFQKSSDSRQERSIKTAIGSANQTEVQIAEQQDEITSPSPAAILDDNGQSTSSFENIKSKGSGNEEQKEAAGIKGIFHEHENKDQVGQDDSKQDRSVKTASKIPSKAESQKTIQQDGIKSVSTGPILDVAQLTTPESPETKYKDNGDQKFPSWEEIIHKSEGSYRHYSVEQNDSKQDRSVKTASKNENVKKAQQQDELTFPLTETTLHEKLESTPTPGSTKSNDQVDSTEEQQSPNKKGISHISDDINQEGDHDIEKSDLKKDSVKFFGKGQAETQTTVQYDNDSTLEEKPLSTIAFEDVQDSSNTHKQGSSLSKKQNSQVISADTPTPSSTKFPLDDEGTKGKPESSGVTSVSDSTTSEANTTAKWDEKEEDRASNAFKAKET